MTIKYLKRSFSGGEITPEMYGRIDQSQYNTGAAVMKNFVPLPHGPAQKRGGFLSVGEFFSSGFETHMIPFFGAGRGGQDLILVSYVGNFVLFGETTAPRRYMFGLNADGSVFYGSDENPTETITFAVTSNLTRNFVPGSGYEYSIPYSSLSISSSNVQAGDVIRVLSPNASVLYSNEVAATWARRLFYVRQTTASTLRLATVSSGTPSVYADALFPPTLPPGGLLLQLAPRLGRELGVGIPKYVQRGNDMLVFPQYPSPEMRGRLSGVFIQTEAVYQPITVRATPNNGLSFSPFGSYSAPPAGTLSAQNSVYPVFARPTATATVSVAESLRTYRYAVLPYFRDSSLLRPRTLVEACVSQQSPYRPNVQTAEVQNNLNLAGNSNLIQWGTPVTAHSNPNNLGALAGFRIYRTETGDFQYIGEVDAGARSFTDNNIVPNPGISPPRAYYPRFGSVNQDGQSVNLPLAAALFEDRLCLAGNRSPISSRRTTEFDDPFIYMSGSSVVMSAPGNLNLFPISNPTQASDAVNFNISSNTVSDIIHMVELGGLVIFTGQEEYLVFSDNASAVTPTTLSVRRIGTRGTHPEIPPLVENASLIFVNSNRDRVVELRAENDAYATRDLVLRVPHLFQHTRVRSLARNDYPFPVVFAAMENRLLYGLTYIPEEQVSGWAQHEVQQNRVLETIKVEPALNVADRTIFVSMESDPSPVIGNFGRFGSLSLLSNPFPSAQYGYSGRTGGVGVYTDLGFVPQLPVTPTVLPLGPWAAGGVCQVSKDGIVVGEAVANVSGTITVDPTWGLVAGDRISYGLKMEATVETLPLAMDVSAGAQGTLKNVVAANLRFSQSGGVSVTAPPTATVRKVDLSQDSSVPGAIDRLYTGETRVILDARWGEEGRIRVVSNDGLPCTLVNITYEIQFGGA